MGKLEKTTLFFREGKSDKTYVATLDLNAVGDGRVTFQWGRRGAAMQSKTFGPMSSYAARALYQGKIEEKRAKGYRDSLADFGYGAAASAPALPGKWQNWQADTIASTPPEPVAVSQPIPKPPKRATPAPVPLAPARRKFRFHED